MPHECTSCGKVFADGSKEMLSGCPNCGGNKFQFRPPGASGPSADTELPEDDPDARTDHASAAAPDSEESRSADGSEAPTDAPSESTTRPDADQGGVRSRVTDWFGSDAGAADADEQVSDPEATDRPQSTADRPDGADGHDHREDTAQASARSDVISKDELAAAANDVSTEERPEPEDDGADVEPEAEERPDLEELRAELNQQFESIKIVSPGKYELNLMELYDREEYIISLREDGRYVIEVPDTWRDE